jgi:hypothetical protein
MDFFPRFDSNRYMGENNTFFPQGPGTSAVTIF